MPERDARLNISQDVNHTKYGPGVSKGPGDGPNTVRVLFSTLGGEKTVPLDDNLTLSDKPTYQDRRDNVNRSRNTYNENVNPVAAPEYQPFLEWLWKNAEIVWQGPAEDAEEFTKWYEKE